MYMTSDLVARAESMKRKAPSDVHDVRLGGQVRVYEEESTK